MIITPWKDDNHAVELATCREELSPCRGIGNLPWNPVTPHMIFSHISVCKRDVVAFGVIGCMFIGALVTLSNGRAAHFSVVFCVSPKKQKKTRFEHL